MIKKFFTLQILLDIFYVFISIKKSYFYILIFINLIFFLKITYNPLAFWKAKRYLRKINSLQMVSESLKETDKNKYSKKISIKINKALSKRRWWVITFGFQDNHGVSWFLDDILNKDRYYTTWKKFQRFKLFFEIIKK